MIVNDIVNSSSLATIDLVSGDNVEMANMEMIDTNIEHIHMDRVNLFSNLVDNIANTNTTAIATTTSNISQINNAGDLLNLQNELTKFAGNSLLFSKVVGLTTKAVDSLAKVQ
jgi:hypothetical protein